MMTDKCNAERDNIKQYNINKCSAGSEESAIPIKALIIPKFEIGEITGDAPGEAQLFYERYLLGAEEHDIKGCENPLYVKAGVAMIIAGAGKTNAAITVTAVLADPRFDFSEAYIFSVGCCGSPVENTVMGDVFLLTAAADGDLGHIADVRDLEKYSDDTATWFHDTNYDDFSYTILNQALNEKAYALVKDIAPATTPKTKSFLGNAFNGAEWAMRDPKVLKGTAISTDNYWKGAYGELNARLITRTYALPDPFVCTDMEESAVARAVKRFGLIDRLLMLRVSVNTDVFMFGNTPESTWTEIINDGAFGLVENEDETADIFETAMHNLFDVGHVLIDAALKGVFE